MDGGSDHCTNVLSVKIAIIVLYHSLNADMILHLWDAPGHSYRNPPEREKERERVNCIPNLGLYGMWD